jgi:hypothetical protein
MHHTDIGYAILTFEIVRESAEGKLFLFENPFNDLLVSVHNKLNDADCARWARLSSQSPLSRPFFPVPICIVNFSSRKMESNGPITYLVLNWLEVLRHDADFDAIHGGFQDLENYFVLSLGRKNLLSFHGMPQSISVFLGEQVFLNFIKNHKRILSIILICVKHYISNSF